MEKSYKLTARQLYYLGKLLKGRYIDYTYISAVEKLLPHFEFYENEIRDELIAKGYLSEEFSGDVTLIQDLRELLNPLFMSTVELSVEKCLLGEAEYLQFYRIHVLGDACVLVKNVEDYLNLSYTNEDEIRKIWTEIMPDDSDYTNNVVLDKIDPNMITEMITIKSSDSNGKCITRTYVVISGRLYIEEEDNLFRAVSKNEFISLSDKTLMEVM